MDQVHLKYDGKDVVGTEHLVEYHDPFLMTQHVMKMVK